jgi:hypothetical protein
MKIIDIFVLDENKIIVVDFDKEVALNNVDSIKVNNENYIVSSVRLHYKKPNIMSLFIQGDISKLKPGMEIKYNLASN